MAEAGVSPDPGRLPWLEPYRPPSRKRSNRRAGIGALVGLAGLTAVVALLGRDMMPSMPAEEDAPVASVVLPAPSDLQPTIMLPPLLARNEPQAVRSPAPVARARTSRHARRRIKAVPGNAAYQEVVDSQAGAAALAEVQVAEAASAVAALPVAPDPPRPAVNPSARVVRGKTVQLGVYLTAQQAESAWQGAIRDYTYLVTMPKNIEPISIRSKRFYRLQLGTPSKNHARQLCRNLQSIGRACTVA